jgi:hypothetical protein
MSRNRCDTTCDCGLDFKRRPELGRAPLTSLVDWESYLKLIDWADCKFEPGGYSDRGTMFGKIICPICRLEYVGWFSPPRMPQYDGPDWEIYDTSFWSSYNDESGEEDRKNWRDPVEVLKSLK